jgi:predicted 3-demethylubiquinone-9 3-methyltransferase (glyoxalase superfamily)
MEQTVTPFLMFEGRAEEAMGFYVSLLKNSSITAIERYGPGEPGPEGKVKRATFSLGGQPFMCIDSPVKHAFSFTPSISLFLRCKSEAEIDRLFAELSKDGQVMMPLGSYPFAMKFAWIADRFGVSWQMILQPV